MLFALVNACATWGQSGSLRLIKTVELPGYSGDFDHFAADYERNRFAQKLAIHATPPGHKNVIVASNFGRIGKFGDEDDLRCIHTGKSDLEVNGPHFEDELNLQDASDKTIGALGVVFNYKDGDSKEALEKVADQTRNEMKAQLPSSRKLFGPTQ
jgi:hypothetical protein